MNRDYVFTREAEGDLLSIWTYTADQWSVEAADRMIDSINRECRKIALRPGIGHFREDLLDKRHKFWRVSPFLIVYRWRSIPLQVVAIVHGARDLEAFLHKR